MEIFEVEESKFPLIVKPWQVVGKIKKSGQKRWESLPVLLWLLVVETRQLIIWVLEW